MLPFFTYKLTQNLHGAVSFSYHTIHSTDSYVQFSTHIKLFYLHQYYALFSTTTSPLSLHLKRRIKDQATKFTRQASFKCLSEFNPNHASFAAARRRWLFCLGTSAIDQRAARLFPILFRRDSESKSSALDFWR